MSYQLPDKEEDEFKMSKKQKSLEFVHRLNGKPD
jgi:hypothetical protein